jgi:hypothetical protein
VIEYFLIGGPCGIYGGILNNNNNNNNNNKIKIVGWILIAIFIRDYNHEQSEVKIDR